MAKTAEQQLAGLIYRLTEKGTTDNGYPEADAPALFNSILGSMLDSRELRLLFQRVRDHPDFEDYRNSIINEWQPVFSACGGPSTRQASSFLRSILDGPFRSQMYGRSLIAGITCIQPDSMLDSVIRHEPDMPSWTLHLHTLGRARIHGCHHISDIDTGDLVLFRPAANCQYQRHPDSAEWAHLWVLFQPREHWLKTISWPEIDEGILHIKLASHSALPQVQQALLEIVELAASGTKTGEDLQMNLLEQVLLRARDALPEKTVDTLDGRIQTACGYISEHLVDAFSVEDVASHCNLSASHLSHLFKSQTGISPKRWRDDLRLQEARRLLGNDLLSIAAIADQLGYYDQQQFSKLFRKKVGCSPTQFRKLKAE
jgi:AraC family transcriptional regulator of arabinose operon